MDNSEYYLNCLTDLMIEYFEDPTIDDKGIFGFVPDLVSRSGNVRVFAQEFCDHFIKTVNPEFADISPLGLSCVNPSHACESCRSFPVQPCEIREKSDRKYAHALARDFLNEKLNADVTSLIISYI